jgi:zinc D-Ala-D-Ala carboxypeptidase
MIIARDIVEFSGWNCCGLCCLTALAAVQFHVTELGRPEMRSTIRPVLLLTLNMAAGAAAQACDTGLPAAATANANNLERLEWAPFRRPELGWAVYATRIATEIGSRCPAMTPGFAADLARWQAGHKLAPTGILDPESFAVMNLKWTLARPFVVQTRGGSCPAPPLPELLSIAKPFESYGGKTIPLHVDALAAYRRMVAAARRSLGPADPLWFTIFSGFRDPVADDGRCKLEGNCQGVARAVCSAHRTGLAIDMHVGAAPGFGPDSSDDANRRAMVRTLAYRWLVTNAASFGFTNYVFEPWHWEWSPEARVVAPGPRAVRPPGGETRD